MVLEAEVQQQQEATEELNKKKISENNTILDTSTSNNNNNDDEQKTEVVVQQEGGRREAVETLKKSQPPPQQQHDDDLRAMKLAYQQQIVLLQEQIQLINQQIQKTNVLKTMTKSDTTSNKDDSNVIEKDTDNNENNTIETTTTTTMGSDHPEMSSSITTDINAPTGSTIVPAAPVLPTSSILPTTVPIISSTSSTVSTTTTMLPSIPSSKRGYLFKWLDRTIGWSGTKWGLRFVVLHGNQGQLSYYTSHLDVTSPNSTSSGSGSGTSFATTTSGGGSNTGGRIQQPRYTLCLRGCAVRDDGWKRNPRYKKQQAGQDPPLDEPGAYFFLFSIYYRPIDNNNNQNDTNFVTSPLSGSSSSSTISDSSTSTNATIVPLLRFSTPSYAEKMLWIQLISESCAYCETEQWLLEETERTMEMEKQQRQALNMMMAMPESKEGTLAPLYFAPTNLSSSSSKSKKHQRRPSYVKTPSAANFRTTSKQPDMDIQEKKLGRNSYPPSKPMHRMNAPSYLSVEAPIQNYRGFFNLGVLILIVSNVRLLMSSVSSHGFVIHQFVNHLKDLRYIQNDPWEQFPFISGFLLQVVFVLVAYSIEYLLSRQRIPSGVGMILHHMNAHMSLCVPLWIVWNFIDKPAIGGVLLFHATITWMKLISYMLANEDYRIMKQQHDDTTDGSMLTLIEDLDPDDVDIRYPDNITIWNMFYFWICPTLTYQIAYPKIPYRRWWKIGGIIMRLVICVSLFTFVAAQVVSPVLTGLVQDLEASGGTYTISMMADYWLKLAIANTYLWLLLFYGYFHLYLNLMGELLRFGDRVFYRDWWNVLDVGTYWRLWNLPVHFWLVRHLYFPCLRHVNKTMATFIVFLLSAIMHEVLVSVPFHMIRPWSFLGMMMQIPLVAITKIASKKSPTLGNMLFWVSFCLVGQPMAALLYTVDYQYAQKHTMECTAGESVGANGVCVQRL